MARNADPYTQIGGVNEGMSRKFGDGNLLRPSFLPPALRTRGAGPLAHQQARPRGRSIMVVSRRKARPFVLRTKLGLQENGRPSLKGMAPWPGPCSVGS
jgi:hypothetical protein